jgi:hypothetical protein
LLRLPQKLQSWDNAPHDIERRSWEDNARTWLSIAADLGIKFHVVPRILDKEDGIEALRRMMGMTWFDSEHCARLIWASNAADAGMTGGGLKPEQVRTARRYREACRGSQWSCKRGVYNTRALDTCARPSTPARGRLSAPRRSSTPRATAAATIRSSNAADA